MCASSTGRVIWAIVLTAALAAPLSAAYQSRQSDTDSLLAQARDALGGESRLAAIKTFTLKGAIKNKRKSVGRGGGGSGDPGSFAIACELPDKFIEIEDRAHIDAGSSASAFPFDANFGAANDFSATGSSASHSVKKLGVNGDAVIHEPESVTAAYTQAQRQGFLSQARAVFANLTVGMFAGSTSAFAPLQFAPPRGSASSAVGVTGQDISGTLRFNPQTHLPQSLNGWVFDDYRDVDGIKVPFKITNGSDEWDVREVRINPEINPRVFKPSGRQ